MQRELNDPNSQVTEGIATTFQILDKEIGTRPVGVSLEYREGQISKVGEKIYHFNLSLRSYGSLKLPFILREIGTKTTV